MITVKKVIKSYGQELSKILSTDIKLHQSLNPKTDLKIISPKDFLKTLSKWQIKNRALSFAILLDKKPIGLISISSINKINKSANIGYWLASQFWNQKITTNAFDIIFKKCQKFGLKTLKATIPKDNLASTKIWQHYKAVFTKNNSKNILAKIILNKKYFIYIIKCKDESLYTGITTDLDRRIKEHNNLKSGAKYTKVRRPVELVYSKEFENRSEASKEESRIKKLTRQQKLNLIYDQ